MNEIGLKEFDSIELIEKTTSIIDSINVQWQENKALNIKVFEYSLRFIKAFVKQEFFNAIDKCLKDLFRNLEYKKFEIIIYNLINAINTNTNLYAQKEIEITNSNSEILKERNVYLLVNNICIKILDLTKQYYKDKIKEPQTSSIGQPEAEQKENTNSAILKTTLKKYNFFELKKVKSLTKKNRAKLLDFINSNDLPYNIAMFDYLDFFKILLKEHFQTKAELYKSVSEWFGVSKRQIKGNILVLNDYSKENRKRYTAHEYKQTVINNYQSLK